MGEVWPTTHITELCLQLTAGSRPVNGDEHRALRSQSCERALLTMGDFTFTFYLWSGLTNTCHNVYNMQLALNDETTRQTMHGVFLVTQ